MRGDRLKIVGLGLAGLVLSAGLGGGAYLLTRDTIGLAVTELEGGAPLAPVAIRQRTAPTLPGTSTATTREVRTTPDTEVGSTEETRTDTVRGSDTRTETDDGSGSGRGRGRGRSGDDDSGRDD